jgi:hypothetical protein
LYAPSSAKLRPNAASQRESEHMAAVDYIDLPTITRRVTRSYTNTTLPDPQLHRPISAVTPPKNSTEIINESRCDLDEPKILSACNASVHPDNADPKCWQSELPVVPSLESSPRKGDHLSAFCLTQVRNTQPLPPLGQAAYHSGSQDARKKRPGPEPDPGDSPLANGSPNVEESCQQKRVRLCFGLPLSDNLTLAVMLTALELGHFDIESVVRYIEQLRRQVISQNDLKSFVGNGILDFDDSTGDDDGGGGEQLVSVGQRWKSVMNSFSMQQLHSNLRLRINRCLFGYRVNLWLRYPPPPTCPPS